MTDNYEPDTITYHGAMDCDDDEWMPKSAPRPEIPRQGHLILQQKVGYVRMELWHPDRYVEYCQSAGTELLDAMEKARALWQVSDPVLEHCHCLGEGKKEQKWRIIFQSFT